MCSCLASSSWWLSMSSSLTTTRRGFLAPSASKQLPAPEEGKTRPLPMTRTKLCFYSWRCTTPWPRYGKKKCLTIIFFFFFFAGGLVHIYASSLRYKYLILYHDRFTSLFTGHHVVSVCCWFYKVFVVSGICYQPEQMLSNRQFDFWSSSSLVWWNEDHSEFKNVLFLCLHALKWLTWGMYTSWSSEKPSSLCGSWPDKPWSPS